MAKNYKFYGGQEETVMEISDDLLMAVWENIGEGWSGDYDPDDPDDKNLLRFTIYIKDYNGNWEQVDDASYCTTVPYDTPEEDLKSKLETIFEEYRDVLDEYPPAVSVKKLGETLSWI